MIHKILMLKGLPGSGKTTLARKLVDKGTWARINKDDLRDMIHNGKWTPDNEDEIRAIWVVTIGVLMATGKNVVIDDTNFNPKHEKDVRDMVKLMNAEAVKNEIDQEWEFHTQFVNTPLEVCIQRDKERGEAGGRSVGEKVIRDMAAKWEVS